MLDVSIVGATGYTGLELVKILLNHPKFNITYIANSTGDTTIDQLHPCLTDVINMEVNKADAKEIAKVSKLCFLALPHKTSMGFAKQLLSLGVKVVDLSADYRLELETYEKYYNDELPRHEVCVDGFWMAKTEVTRGQFKQFIKETGYRTDADKKGNAYIFNKETDWKWKELPGYNWEKTGYSQDDAHPVVCVSWNDAKEFIKWLSTKTGQNFALPTEAQWAYAARGGTDFMRFWGTNVAEACKYANVADKDNWITSFPCSDGYEYTSPVGKYKPNPFGLYDMLGNVWEWCEDVYDKNAYSRHVRNNPVITSGGNSRVSRGGSWNNDPRCVRAANRGRSSAGIRNSFIGFRLCLSRVRQ